LLVLNARLLHRLRGLGTGERNTKLVCRSHRLRWSDAWRYITRPASKGIDGFACQSCRTFSTRTKECANRHQIGCKSGAVFCAALTAAKSIRASLDSPISRATHHATSTGPQKLRKPTSALRSIRSERETILGE